MVSYGDDWAHIYDSVIDLSEDIPFWVAEAQASGGPVLELGSGTGRVAIPIAQAGVSVVGVDSSSEMVKAARAKARKLRLGKDVLSFVKGDMRDISLGRRFPLAIIPFRAFQFMLSPADQFQALATIKEHLAPGGRVVFSIFVPDLGLLTRDPSTPLYDREIVNAVTRRRVSVWHHNRYDNFSQVIDACTIFEELDERGEVVQKSYHRYQICYLYRFEVQHLLMAAGYRVLEVYGSFDRSPLDETSTEMIWVATPEG